MESFSNRFQNKYQIRKVVLDHMGTQEDGSNVSTLDMMEIDIYNKNLQEADGYIANRYYPIFASRFLTKILKKIKRKIAVFFVGNYLDCLAVYEGKIINVLSVNRDMISQQQDRITELEEKYNHLSEQYDSLIMKMKELSEVNEDIV